MATEARNDAQHAALAAAGYTGQLLDMEFSFWTDFVGLTEIPWGDDRIAQMETIATAEVFSLDYDSRESVEYSFWTQAALS